MPLLAVRARDGGGGDSVSRWLSVPSVTDNTLHLRVGRSCIRQPEETARAIRRCPIHRQKDRFQRRGCRQVSRTDPTSPKPQRALGRPASLGVYALPGAVQRVLGAAVTNAGMNQDRMALTEIGRIAAAAGAYGEQGTMAGDGQAGASQDWSCRIMPLPPRLVEQSARHAIRVNPSNAPLREQPVPAGMVSPPQRLVVLVGKYWGATQRVLSVSFMEPTPPDLRARILAHERLGYGCILRRNQRYWRGTHLTWTGRLLVVPGH